MSKVREIPWPEEFSELKRIEEYMICGICYEYMETTVMTPCSHNYCSLCIRKYLHYKTQCPACFHNVFEKDLYINRTMDGLIDHYLQLREKLITLIENRVVYNKVIQTESDTVHAGTIMPVRPVRYNQQPKSPQIIENKIKNNVLPESPKGLVKNLNTPKTPISSPLASTSKCNPCSPILSKSPKTIPSIAKIFNTPKRKDTVPQPSVNSKSVSCPVCKVDISEQHINVHLDACLKREVGQPSIKEKVDPPKRPPLPKLVLRVMKDLELRKKMKELGLSTQGDRRTLENRFTRYSTIYNAESDKLDPRPIADLIRQCEMEEKQERKMDMFLVSANSAPTVRLQIERNAKEEKIEEAQKSYRTANKSSFDKLIEEVKKRRMMTKSKHKNSETTSSTGKEDNESNDSNCKQDNECASSSKQDSVHTTISNSTNPTKANTVLESVSESEDNNSYNPAFEIAFQDSDSDESCPLQHYRSDDPMKSLIANLNDSSPCTSTSGSPKKKLEETKIEKINDNKITAPSVLNKSTSNPYEVPTDKSSDDDIPSSPIINKNTNRKRVKLSNKTLNKSGSSEGNDRVNKARAMCNSIIQDFSFDGNSDDSLSEFVVNCKNEDVKKFNEVKVNKSLNEANNKNQAILQKETDSSCDKKVPENNSFEEFASKILNDDLNEFVDLTTMDNSETQKLKSDETVNIPLRLNLSNVEKENDAASVNEHEKSCVNESTVRRPVRKRNRPSRFANSEKVEKDVEQKTPTRLSEESQDSTSPDHFKSPSSDGSLKRRRGRPRANNKSQASNENQNPPKRPVRRRQVVSNCN